MTPAQPQPAFPVGHEIHDKLRSLIRVAVREIVHIDLTLSQHRELATALLHALPSLGFIRLPDDEALAQWLMDNGLKCHVYMYRFKAKELRAFLERK